MPDPEGIKSAMSGMFSNMFASGSSKYMVYVGYFLIAGVIIAIGFLFYYMIMYKYKITIFEGSLGFDKSGDRTITVRRITTDRAMPVMDKGMPKWRLLKQFGKKLEPIDFKYIMPNNRVFLFKTSPTTFNPIPIKVSNPSAVFDIEPFDRAFLNLGVQNDAREYMKDGQMQKAQIWMFVSGLIILIAIVVSGWLILKYSAHTAAVSYTHLTLPTTPYV